MTLSGPGDISNVLPAPDPAVEPPPLVRLDVTREGFIARAVAEGWEADTVRLLLRGRVPSGPVQVGPYLLTIAERAR